MNHSLQHQKGAVLVVALVMLLVILLLAVSSTRESALEARMTGNFVSQQQQQNLADGASREGEAQMTSATLMRPREPNATNGACAGANPDIDTDDPKYCFSADAAQYAHAFGNCDTGSTKGVKSSVLKAAAGDPRRLRWYAIPAPSGATEGASENPEYGNMMAGNGTFRYEINTLARDDNNKTCTILRTTTVKVFN